LLSTGRWHGQCDGLYINTSGIGEAIDGFNLGPDKIVEGDDIIVSGTLADHGFAVLAARQNINIKNGPVSDTAPVHELVSSIKRFAPEVRFMRDPTRGGLASVLNEMAENRNFGILLEEARIPLSPGTRALSETLGIDPLHVPSEGRIVLACSPAVSGRILEKWQSMRDGRDAAVIGKATGGAGRVTIRTATGGTRIVDVPRGELLPRIC